MPNASSSAAIWSLSSTERLSPSLCVPSRSVVSNRKTSVASGTRHLLVALGPERLELRELAVDHRRERSARQRLHGLGQQPDGLEHFAVAGVLGPSTGATDDGERARPVGGIADGQATHDRLRLDGPELLEPLLPGAGDRGAT